MHKRVLVTGVNGFAGSYLAPLLADAGYEVMGTTKAPDEAALPGVASHFAVDLRDSEHVTAMIAEVKPTHVIHLAAISFVAHSDVSEIYTTNVVGTRNLLNGLAKLESRPQSVLLVSSANVYGNSLKGVLSEDEPFNPANDYAVSKAAMEMMARQFADRLPVVTCRPFNYTGRGQGDSFLIPKIVNHFRRREPVIELGNLEVARDFSDVRVVVCYMRVMIESAASAGHTYNICSGRLYSLDWVINQCRALTGHNIEVRVNPAFVRSNEVKNLSGDPSRLHDLAGDVADIAFEDTLSWMLAK